MIEAQRLYHVSQGGGIAVFELHRDGLGEDVPCTFARPCPRHVIAESNKFSESAPGV
jgi:hypothetical protein